jgi:hypothetical protein
MLGIVDREGIFAEKYNLFESGFYILIFSDGIDELFDHFFIVSFWANEFV